MRESSRWFAALPLWAKAAFAGEMLLVLGLAIYLRQVVFPTYGVPLGLDFVVIQLLIFWCMPAAAIAWALERWTRLSTDVSTVVAFAIAWLFAVALTVLWINRGTVLQ